MILGKVGPAVVATHKHSALEGHKMFWVEPVKADGSANGAAFIALDSVDAGPGDLVIVCNEGNGCRQVFDAGVFPVNHVITGFVDHV